MIDLQSLRKIACADWSADLRNRAAWLADADEARIRRLEPPRAGWSVRALFAEAADDSPPSLLAFDAPLGLPRSFLAATGSPGFVSWLEDLSQDTLTPVTSAADWSVRTPFVRPTGKGSWLAVEQAARTAGVELLREVDRATGAQSVFRCVGAKQVAGAARALWRELQDLRKAGRDFAIWPFEESSAPFVVAEIYPAALFEQAVGFRPVKSDPFARERAVRQLQDEGVCSPDDGAFARSSIDDFDAALAAAALLRRVIEERPLATVVDRYAEGAILGV